VYNIHKKKAHPIKKKKRLHCLEHTLDLTINKYFAHGRKFDCFMFSNSSPHADIVTAEDE
jgi:hypothetical protein